MTLEVTQFADAVEVRLYGVIGADKSKGMIDDRSFVEALEKIPEPMPVRLRLNSPGGNAYMGLAMKNALAARSKSVAIVDGIAASAAATVLQGAKVRQIARNGIVMIHRAKGEMFGTADDLVSAASALKAVDQSTVDMFAERTGRPADEVAAMLNATTYMTAAEAKSKGFVDEIVSEKSAVRPQQLDVLQSLDLPESFWSLTASWKNENPEQKGDEMTTQTPATPATEQAEVSIPRGTLIATLLQLLGIGGTVAAPAQAATPATQTPVQVPATITVPDSDQAAILAAQKAKEVEDAANKRAVDIVAACQLAGCPEKAAKFITDGTDTAAVNAQLLQHVCTTRQPVGGDGTTPAVGGGAPNVDQRYIDEFKAEPIYQKSMTQAEYVAMRRVDDGVDALKVG